MTEVARVVVRLLQRPQHEPVSARRAAPAVRGTHCATSCDASPTTSAACWGVMRQRGTGGVGTPSDASWSISRSHRRRLGPLVHPVQRRHRALLEHARDLLVGGDHQVLDQPVGLGLRDRSAADHVPRPVELELRLGAFEHQRRPRAPAARRAPPPPRAPPRAARPTARRARSRPAKMRSTCS